MLLYEVNNSQKTVSPTYEAMNKIHGGLTASPYLAELKAEKERHRKREKWR